MIDLEMTFGPAYWVSYEAPDVLDVGTTINLMVGYDHEVSDQATVTHMSIKRDFMLVLPEREYGYDGEKCHLALKISSNMPWLATTVTSWQMERYAVEEIADWLGYSQQG